MEVESCIKKQFQLFTSLSNTTKMPAFIETGKPSSTHLPAAVPQYVWVHRNSHKVILKLNDIRDIEDHISTLIALRLFSTARQLAQLSLWMLQPFVRLYISIAAPFIVTCQGLMWILQSLDSSEL